MDTVMTGNSPRGLWPPEGVAPIWGGAALTGDAGTTVNLLADASFDHGLSRGSYAYWIEGPSRRHCEAGPFPRAVQDSTQAELEALGKAIRTAIEVFDLGEGDSIVAVSDCKYAVSLLNGSWSLREDRRADKRVVDRVRSLLRQHKVTLLVKHTRGHQGTATAISAINTWCDLMAKAAMVGHKAGNLLIAGA